MDTAKLKELGFIPVVEAEQKEITGGFCGDLLSWAMGKAKSGDCWFTVMGNLNVIAVASLADVAAVVLCQDVQLAQDAQKRAVQEGICVFRTELSEYEAAIRFYNLYSGKD